MRVDVLSLLPPHCFMFMRTEAPPKPWTPDVDDDLVRPSE